ncbi:hypothetical protein PIROE2DRAFT_57161 [Piromyces sp. E2]|nr:hypothetical protein PIROE2DRAFT_57161 [Piromyces sp. E2]|eukprot:OUM69914.1 hypothetical protein PIROE2DRAFT_57161 [Piromyces sp. E2]
MDNIRVSIFDLNDSIHVNKGYLKALEEPEENDSKDKNVQSFIIKPWHALSKILLYKLLSLDESVDNNLKKKINSIGKKDDDEWFDYIRKNYDVPLSSVYQISPKIPFTIQHQCQSLYNYNHSSAISKVLYTPVFNGVISFISIDPLFINIWKGSNLYKKIKRDINKNYMKIKELIWIEKQRIIIASTDNLKLLVFNMNMELIRTVGCEMPMISLKYIPNSDEIIIGSFGVIKVYSYDTNERIKTYNEIHPMSITEILYCEAKDYLITGGREGLS